MGALVIQLRGGHDGKDQPRVMKLARSSTRPSLVQTSRRMEDALGISGDDQIIMSEVLDRRVC